jgi:hypothetical protein
VPGITFKKNYFKTRGSSGISVKILPIYTWYWSFPKLEEQLLVFKDFFNQRCSKILFFAESSRLWNDSKILCPSSANCCNTDGCNGSKILMPNATAMVLVFVRIVKVFF